MARSFKKEGVKENIISVPGPAAESNTYANSYSPGAATTEPSTEEVVEKQSNVLNTDLNERANQIREDANTSEKNYSVGYYDIDEALGYYIDNIIKPAVVENGELIPVPTIYGSPERWRSMQEFGYYRDNKSKIILPLIMYKKTTLARSNSILFPRVNQLYYASVRKWDSKNKYDNFSIKNPKRITDKYSLTYLPNYIDISYEGVIQTSFTEQLNKIIEKFQFAENSYWGDKNKFKFRTMIDSFDTATELNTDTERLVKATFNITVYGYILTEDFNNTNTSKLALGPKKITFTESPLIGDSYEKNTL